MLHYQVRYQLPGMIPGTYPGTVPSTWYQGTLSFFVQFDPYFGVGLYHSKKANWQKWVCTVLEYLVGLQAGGTRYLVPATRMNTEHNKSIVYTVPGTWYQVRVHTNPTKIANWCVSPGLRTCE